jgi:RNA polymerase sigma-70 factor (ECF subfamily)
VGDAVERYASAALQENTIREPDSEGVLLRRAAKGDEDAFTALYRRHEAVLYRFALRMTGSRWAAEEIVQDVFMTLIRDPEKFDASRGTVRALLHGITRNRVLKHFERAPREVSLDAVTSASYAGGNGEVRSAGSAGKPPQDPHTPHTRAEAAERVSRVRAAVLALPSEYREAVALCDLEELSYEEAAERMECPVGTVRSRLHRGRVLLLAQLELLRGNVRRERVAAPDGETRNELRGI